MIARKNKTFGNYEVVKVPGQVSCELRSVPAHIAKPPYSLNVKPPPGPTVPENKSCVQIQGMRASCALARKTLNYAKDLVKVRYSCTGIQSMYTYYSKNVGRNYYRRTR